ncbi:MAG: diphthine--ammonia ligase [Candidatus Bathyarchaeota archaeon]|jgi:uncharacterized protein (TIGR00290 family)|nr:diphthine--ammonia ligase [Candidatus Bathyarchaeota archaeon A05DMB-3]MDH7606999.1 diphthine--ammonia ligase [Candidatus Bathyarchaeota archaeon]
MSAAVSWSGGKESCLALYKALRDGLKVSNLLTFTSKNKRCMSHGLHSKMILAQSKALGIPLIQRKVTWETYGQGFRKALNDLKRMGVEKLIVGDIFEIPAHEGWVDNICKELNIALIKPLWHRNSLKILKEFVNEGFEAIVIKAKADLLDENWIGRKINNAFIKHISQLKNVNPCGELGEYHTFVYNGPIFKKSITIEGFEKKLVNNYWFLDITKVNL